MLLSSYQSRPVSLFWIMTSMRQLKYVSENIYQNFKKTNSIMKIDVPEPSEKLTEYRNVLRKHFIYRQHNIIHFVNMIVLKRR